MTTAVSSMRAAVVQLSSTSNVQANLDETERLLREAVSRGAQLAVLPENFALMPSKAHQRADHAEQIGSGPQQQFLADRARELGLWIIGGTLPIAAPDGRSYATSLVYAPDGQRAHRYDKLHLFDVHAADGESYRESDTLAPGDIEQSLPVVDVDGVQVGLSVCYDLRFAEHYRRMVGAQVLTVPSAFTHTTGAAHWEVLLRARAVENMAFVLAPNQCGRHDNGRRTWGHSMIVDPWGKVLAELDEAPGVAVADLNFEAQAHRRASFPALEHRRL